MTKAVPENVLVSPSGDAYDVPAGKIAELAAKGWRPRTQAEIDEETNQIKYGQGVAPAVAAGAAGLVRGATLGASDIVASTLLPDGVQEALRELKARQPVASGVGEAASFLLPGLAAAKALKAASPGVASVARVAGMPQVGLDLVGTQIGNAVAKVAGKRMAGIASPAAKLAAEAAIMQGALNVSESVLEDRELTAEAILANTGDAALFGAGLGAVFPVTGKLARFSYDTAVNTAAGAARSLSEVMADAAAKYSPAAADLLDQFAKNKGKSIAAVAAQKIAGVGDDAKRVIEQRLLPEIRESLIEKTGSPELVDKILADFGTEKGMKYRDELLATSLRTEQERLTRNAADSLQELYDSSSGSEGLWSQIKRAEQAAKLSKELPEFDVAVVPLVYRRFLRFADDVGKFSGPYQTKAKDIINEVFKKKIDSPQAMMSTLDNAKRKLDAMAKFEKGVLPTSSEGFAAEEVRKFRGEIQDILESKDFGGAGIVQREFNERYSEYMGAKTELQKALFTTQKRKAEFGERFLVDGGKVSGMIRNIGNPKSDKARRAIERYQKSVLDLNNYTMGLSDGLSGAISAGKIAGDVGQLSKARKTAVQSVVDKSAKSMTTAESKLADIDLLLGGNRSLGQMETNASMRSADLGNSMTKIFAGYAIGGKYGALLAGAMERWGAIKSNPLTAIKYLSFAEGAILKTEAQIADAVDGFISTGATGVGGVLREAGKGSATAKKIADQGIDIGQRLALNVGEVAANAAQKKYAKFLSATSPTIARISAGMTTPREREESNRRWFVETRDKIQAGMNNQTVAPSMIAAASQAPMLVDDVSSRMARDYAYLWSVMPKDPGMPMSVGDAAAWVPSDAAIADFRKAVRVAEKPLSILADLQAGTVTYSQVNALKAMRPKIYDRIRGAFAEKVSVMGSRVPYDKRLRLSLLFGLPMDTSMGRDAMAFFQQPEQNQNPSGQPSSQKTRVNRELNFSGRSETNSQRIEGRQ